MFHKALLVLVARAFFGGSFAFGAFGVVVVVVLSDELFGSCFILG